MAKVVIDGVELTREEKEELYYSISCRLGIIETGTPMMRAKDAVNCGEQRKIKALTSEQMKLISDLEKIMYKLI